MQYPSHSWFGTLQGHDSSLAIEPRQNSFVRLWRAFMTARITIASILVALQAVIYAFGTAHYVWPALLCVAYLLATLAVRLLSQPKPPRRTFDAQWMLTVGLDVVVFSWLNFLPASGMNYTPLFALPVLLSSILGPILLALGTAASVTLLLLLDAWWMSVQMPGDSAARFLQAGLSGTGFFAVALLANQLTLRLAREEQSARVSQQATRIQTQVNQLVIETLTDGVLVIDAAGIVRSANPASQRLMTIGQTVRTPPFVLATQAAFEPLVDIMKRTFTDKQPHNADIALSEPGNNLRHLHVRTRLAAAQDNTDEALCVMFLEDLREVEANVRVAKMAAMGRMSAAMAHEIRNPLAAIVQANALLDEDMKEPSHRQLTAMIAQNAQRLAKIVDDVLNISRVQVLGPEEHGMALMLDEVAARIAREWTAQTSAGSRIHISLNAVGACVVFDPEHMRRLMVNLLDNALRYARLSSHAIQVISLVPPDGQARLSVWSDGPLLEKSVQAHLFEPFFSSESRSSGLGLYICRQLCERYGAQIGYQRTKIGTVQGNEFFVSFKLAKNLQAATTYTADDLFA